MAHFQKVSGAIGTSSAGLIESKKQIADGRWKMEAARAWLLRPNRDRLPVRLPSDGEPSRLAVAWAWELDPRNDELLMFAGDGIFRISVERP
jgi:hypothetical protein